MDAAHEHIGRNKRRTARAEASAWIVRLHGPHRTADVESGFRAWLAADPENAQQFERVTEIWDSGATPVPGIARMAHGEERSARPWLRAAAVAVVVLGTVGWGLNSFWLNPSYATGIGEQRIVRLPDGTRITLNSNSRVGVAYRTAQRRVHIERGEAFFEVAKDSARPFLVHAGEHEVTALSTAFVVRYEPQRLAVTLVEGKIGISVPASGVSGLDGSDPETLDAGTVKILAPGERLVLAKNQPPKIDAPRMDAVTAWRRGEIILDKTPLAEAIAEMNRYDQNTLVIEDPEIAAFEISGIYHTGDSELFAGMIAKLYGLKVRREGGRIVIGMQPSPFPTASRSRNTKTESAGS